MTIVMCGGCTTEQCNSGRACARPVESFTGAVLETFERNGYHDSDFVAVVWDGARVTTCAYASTSYWSYHNHARVDATPQVQAAALAWYRARLVPYLIGEAREKARRPRKGSQVRSLTTRGKNVGITGEVKWIGPDRYRDGERVGVKVDGEAKLRYLAADRVEVTSPDLVDEDELKGYASTAHPRGWHSALRLL
jgi:hypothetical protein